MQRFCKSVCLECCQKLLLMKNCYAYAWLRFEILSVFQYAVLSSPYHNCFCAALHFPPGKSAERRLWRPLRLPTRLGE